jgi:hypothetical protein
MGEHTSGEHRRVWTGTGTSGAQIAPGIYFLRLRTGSGSTTRKLIRLH